MWIDWCHVYTHACRLKLGLPNASDCFSSGPNLEAIYLSTGPCGFSFRPFTYVLEDRPSTEARIRKRFPYKDGSLHAHEDHEDHEKSTDQKRGV
jgi:hypothetical protein